MEYRIFCDESCHLEKDNSPVMLLGGLWLEKGAVQSVSNMIQSLQTEHNANGELKWNKVSASKLDFYKKIVDLYCETSSINFRCLLIENKHHLNHTSYNQNDPNSFYYKMYFLLLKELVNIENRFEIFIDIKDTRGGQRIELLKKILCNQIHDFERFNIKTIQLIQSSDSRPMQLCDFLMGAIGHHARGLSPDTPKGVVAEYLRKKVGIGPTFLRTSPRARKKLNIFVFTPEETSL